MPDSPAKIEYSEKGKSSKIPIVLAIVVGIAAAVIAAWGVNSNALMAGISAPAPAPVLSVVLAAPANKDEAERLLKAGASVHQERCAGCHAIDAKLVGPSYSEISKRYKNLSEVGFASTHPRNDLANNGWDGYDDGPHLHLSKEEQRAVAVWILERTKEKEAGND